MLRRMALALPHATEELKFSTDLCLCIGEKIFAVAPVEGEFSVTLKMTPDDWAYFLEQPGFEKAPYVGRYQWITVKDVYAWSRDEWQSRIQNSYALIKSKLPKKQREALQ